MMSIPRSIKRGRRPATRVFCRKRSGSDSGRQVLRREAARNLLRELRGDVGDYSESQTFGWVW